MVSSVASLFSKSLIRKLLILFILPLLIVSCSKKFVVNLDNPNKVADEYGFNRVLLKGGDFWITTYQKITNQDMPYTFYIEGDGIVQSPWHKYVISDNPTPHNKTLLALASKDTRPNIIYIARPCQYTRLELNPKCRNNAYWTDMRFSDEVVSAIDEIIEQTNNDLPFSLVGYSGGGAIAMLIALRNSNVKDILTIAGNLDHRSFSKHHKALPILRSLNPIDYAKTTNHIPQLHVTGGSDKVILPFITDSYVKEAANDKCVKHIIVPNVQHQKGWEDAWQYILNIPIICYHDEVNG